MILDRCGSTPRGEKKKKLFPRKRMPHHATPTPVRLSGGIRLKEPETAGELNPLMALSLTTVLRPKSRRGSRRA